MLFQLFATDVVECRWYWLSLTPAANLSLVSLTLVANLSPVSTTSAAPVAKFASCVSDTGGEFASGVVDTGGLAAIVVDTSGAPWLANNSVNFRNFKMTLMLFSGAGGEDDSWKKPEAKNLVILSL